MANRFANPICKSDLQIGRPPENRFANPLSLFFYLFQFSFVAMACRDGYQLAWSCFGAFGPPLQEDQAMNLIETLRESKETRDQIVAILQAQGLRSAGPKASRMICLYCFECRAANISYGIQHLVKAYQSCPQSIKSALSSYALNTKSVRVARARGARSPTADDDSSTFSSSQKSSHFEPSSKRRPDTITQYMDRPLKKSD